MIENICDAVCPACAHQIALPFLDGEMATMATLCWPRSREEAQTLPELPLDFVRCVRCGHIFNKSFDYSVVPYSSKPNLMYNQGPLWNKFLCNIQRGIVDLLPKNPTVIEIGHGDGNFLINLSKITREGNFIGFDPNGAAIDNDFAIFRRELFDPRKHLKEFSPDMLISRHVLEHLSNPLKFLQNIAFFASCYGCSLLTYFEVPCIDNAIRNKRTVDFYYEHNSQFTTLSFTKMVTQCSQQILEIGHGYKNEVIYSIAKLGVLEADLLVAKETMENHASHISSKSKIMKHLNDLYVSGKSIIFWGGTGKSAAFLNRYNVDAHRFPVVIDSDRSKVGTYVPGCGQLIQSTDWFQDHLADVVVIPPQWRARDIIEEMKLLGLSECTVYIEHEGALVDFFNSRHPY